MAMMMAGGTPEATILWGSGEEKSGNVVMIPAALGGYAVTTGGKWRAEHLFQQQE